MDLFVICLPVLVCFLWLQRDGLGDFKRMEICRMVLEAG